MQDATQDRDQPPGQDGQNSESPAVDLERRLAELTTERDEAKDQALRALAEAENTRRRVERERAEALRYAAVPLLRDLVKVADHLGRALDAMPEAELDEKSKAFRDGVALTERELLAVLEKHKAERIEPLGQKFDPNLHEAVFEVADPTQEPGTIVQVLETGWKLHDRLIRPARVAVAKAA
ncbi:MAG TPA: nucleotide exchange factor GrpE [Kiloniellales bacterium]|nr:nucleotide exchange factor GrpE [Kiloniellales bacterium]